MPGACQIQSELLTVRDDVPHRRARGAAAPAPRERKRLVVGRSRARDVRRWGTACSLACSMIVLQQLSLIIQITVLVQYSCTNTVPGTNPVHIQCIVVCTRTGTSTVYQHSAGTALQYTVEYRTLQYCTNGSWPPSVPLLNHLTSIIHNKGKPTRKSYMYISTVSGIIDSRSRYTSIRIVLP